MKQNTMVKFFIMKKTCLCIVGLLLMGMLCMPVAATTVRPGYWNFDVVSEVSMFSELKLNGHGDDGDANYQRVYVSDADYLVEVQLEETAGPDTTLTIKKDYITTLRNKCQHGWEPALVAKGGFLTYDVEAVCINTVTTRRGSQNVHDTKVYELLKERGLYHDTIGSFTYVLDYDRVVERHVCRKHHLCS